MGSRYRRGAVPGGVTFSQSHPAATITSTVTRDSNRRLRTMRCSCLEQRAVKGIDKAGHCRIAATPLSVKVDVVPPALPQPGLNLSDIVWEELVEGGQTRLFVPCESQDADPIDQIRSARPVDAERRARRCRLGPVGR